MEVMAECWESQELYVTQKSVPEGPLLWGLGPVWRGYQEAQG